MKINNIGTKKAETIGYREERGTAGIQKETKKGK